VQLKTDKTAIKTKYQCNSKSPSMTDRTTDAKTLLGKFRRHFRREEPLGNCVTFYNLSLHQFVN